MIITEGMSDDELNDALEYARNRRAEDVYNALMVIKDYHFQLGDILIKNSLHNYYNDNDEYVSKWEIEPFSKRNKAPRKYKVVHIDDVGLHYIQKIRMQGDLCGELICLAAFDSDYDKFEYDPDFLDHQILAEEEESYDPQELYREKRDEHFKLRPKTKRKTKQAETPDGNSGSSVSTVS